MTQTGPTRAALATLALVAAGLIPLSGAAAAGAPPLPLFVGDLLVDAAGHVSGANLDATLNEATGEVTQFQADGTDVFRAVRIEGFAQAQKLQGVGSPTLLLQGNDAALSLFDDAHSALQVEATHATSVAFDLAPGVQAVARTAGHVDLLGPGEQWIGSLVAAGADGPASLGDSLSVADGAVTAHAKQGSDIIFLAASRAAGSSPDADALQRAVVAAAAHGDLASSYVTEFHANGVSATQLDAARGFVARSTASASGIDTLVGSDGATPALLSYDLAYETLPVHSADDIAVYVDGKLATQARSADEVRDLAAQGVAASYATLHDGRALVLASTSDFLASGEHAVTVTASHALTQAQARAESAADARILGDLALGANGKVTGDFLSAQLDQSGALLSGFTTLPDRLEVFQALRVDGNAQGATLTLDGQHLRVDGSKADLTLVDDAFGTLLLDAKQQADATFQLAPGVTARSDLSDLVHLTGPHGVDAGSLLVLDRAGDSSSSSLHATDGAVDAQLDQGARVVYRAASLDGFASDGSVAQAIANGRAGAQLLAGQATAKAGGVATAHAEYVSGVLSSVSSRARGELEVQYASPLDGARSFVLDAKGESLAAKSAGDVLVLVDGQPAVPVANAETAFALGQQARSFVETGSDGALRVIVNVAGHAGQTAHVLIAAQDAANPSEFGAFKLFQDGSAVGSFVKLHADRASGAVSHFGLLGAQRDLFDSLVAGDSPFQANGADGAATLVLENQQATLSTADDAQASLRIVAKQATDASFHLAEGVRPEATAQGVIALKDDAGNELGSVILVGPGQLAASGSDITARLAAGQQLLFHADAGLASELSANERQMLDEAIARGHVAGDVLVQTQDLSDQLEASSTDALAQASEVTSSVIAPMSDVQMVAAATKDRVQVTLSSASSVGKTLLVTLDPSSVSGLANGQADVLFDGQPIHEADSLADVLDATNDAGKAEYFVLSGEAGSQVLVSVPHFSVHTVTIQGHGEGAAGSSPVYLYASVFLGLLVAVETALLIRSKNRRN